MVSDQPGINLVVNTQVINESWSPPTEESGLPREAYALLAQANLLRMRGHWEEAVKNCMTALRLAPNSSSAQSLLGDIYENQGRFDDAIQWYRMALDADPDSPADQIKLHRLLQRQSPPELAGPLGQMEALSEPQRLPILRLQRLSQDPEITLRYTALAASLLLLLVVGLAYVAAHHQTTLVSLGLANKEVEAKPVMVPTEGSPMSIIPVTMRDASEQALLDALRSSSDLSGQGITMEDVQTDPRTQEITLTIGLTAASIPARSTVLSASLHTIEAAANLSSAAPIFTLRCLLLPGDSTTSNGATLLFTGDFARSVLPASGQSDPSFDLLLTDFTDIWWSPQITV